MNPIDEKKAAELAQESVSVGNDKWGNAQNVLNKIEAERKAAEQVRIKPKLLIIK